MTSIEKPPRYLERFKLQRNLNHNYSYLIQIAMTEAPQKKKMFMTKSIILSVIEHAEHFL